MKSFKKVALAIVAAVMMLMMSVNVFAADSPVKTNFNASLKKYYTTYNGKVQKPKVVVKDAKGKTINSKYYKVTYKKSYNFKDNGTYRVVIKGTGKYAGFQKTLTYKIKAKTQKVTLKSTDKYTVKASAVKKSSKTLKKAIKVTKKTGKISYTTNNSKIKVNKNGKIVVAKGTKKGTYQVKVTVKAKNYKTVNKYITVTVK